ncbi:MAG: DUF6036 family nucleotidyltransferase [Longimicrobiales bacterium]
MKPIQDIDQALRALGELLAAAGEQHAIVVLGGAALNLLGFVQRVTRDVDVIAIAHPDQLNRLERPSQLSETLERAVETVARDLRLAPDWLNIVAAGQWDTGLPPGMETRLHWRRYDGLWVGLVDRQDLIFFKLYAAADDVGPHSVHFQDLLSLEPSDSELDAAAAWIESQDSSPQFLAGLQEVVRHVREAR